MQSSMSLARPRKPSRWTLRVANSTANRNTFGASHGPGWPTSPKRTPPIKVSPAPMVLSRRRLWSDENECSRASGGSNNIMQKVGGGDNKAYSTILMQPLCAGRYWKHAPSWRDRHAAPAAPHVQKANDLCRPSCVGQHIAALQTHMPRSIPANGKGRSVRIWPTELAGHLMYVAGTRPGNDLRSRQFLPS